MISVVENLVEPQVFEIFRDELIGLSNNAFTYFHFG